MEKEEFKNLSDLDFIKELQIPDCLKDADLDFSRDLKFIYFLLCVHKNEDFFCTLSNKQISNMVKLHPVQVEVHINELKDLDFIIVEYSKDRKKRMIYPLLAEKRNQY